MKKMPISLLGGIVAIVVTIILYFTILGDAFLEAICLITLLGVVAAELVATALAYFADGKPRKVAAVTVSALMIPVSILLSVVYIVNFPEGYATYAAWYLVCFIIVGAIAAVLFFFDSQKTAEDVALQNARANILNMRKIVKCIMIDPSAGEYKEKLNALEEKLHFSNNSVIVAQDQQIYTMLISLQKNISNPEFDSLALIRELDKAIDSRNIMVSRNV